LKLAANLSLARLLVVKLQPNLYLAMPKLGSSFQSAGRVHRLLKKDNYGVTRLRRYAQVEVAQHVGAGAFHLLHLLFMTDLYITDSLVTLFKISPFQSQTLMKPMLGNGISDEMSEGISGEMSDRTSNPAR
jgi:hypothetical protein